MTTTNNNNLWQCTDCVQRICIFIIYFKICVQSSYFSFTSCLFLSSPSVIALICFTFVSLTCVFKPRLFCNILYKLSVWTCSDFGFCQFLICLTWVCPWILTAAAFQNKDLFEDWYLCAASSVCTWVPLQQSVTRLLIVAKNKHRYIMVRCLNVIVTTNYH